MPTFMRKEARLSTAFTFVLKAVKNTITGVGLSLDQLIAQEIIKVFERTSSALALSYKRELIKVIKDNRPFLRIRRRRIKKRRKKFFFKNKKGYIFSSKVFIKKPVWYIRWRILPKAYKNKKYRFGTFKKFTIQKPVRLFLRKFRWKVKKRVTNFRLHWKIKKILRTKKFRRFKFLKTFSKSVVPLYRIMNKVKTKQSNRKFKRTIAEGGDIRKGLYYRAKRNQLFKRNFKKYKYNYKDRNTLSKTREKFFKERRNQPQIPSTSIPKNKNRFNNKWQR